jgi:hypothetical protein
MDYEERCRAATTDQGLDPVVAALTAAGIPHTVEQTGGMTMVLTVPTGPTSFLGVTLSESDHDDGYPSYFVCEYPTLDWEDGETLNDNATLAELVALARERTKPLTGVALGIYQDVIRAMQNAEEMGGPEGADYDALMKKIADECLSRRKTRQAQEGER